MQYPWAPVTFSLLGPNTILSVTLSVVLNLCCSFNDQLPRPDNTTTVSNAGFKVLTAVVMKSAMFWDITPCRFGRTYRPHLQVRRISRAKSQCESRWKAEPTRCYILKGSTLQLLWAIKNIRISYICRLNSKIEKDALHRAELKIQTWILCCFIRLRTTGFKRSFNKTRTPLNKISRIHISTA
jgi:hypothetical protein